MTSSTLDDLVLRQARARASAGAWPEVAAMLRDAAGAGGGTAGASHAVRRGADAHRRAASRLRLPAGGAARAVAQRPPGRASHGAQPARRGQLRPGRAGRGAGRVGPRAGARAAGERPAARGTRDEQSRRVASLRGAWHDALYLYQLAVPMYQRLGDMHRLARDLPQPRHRLSRPGRAGAGGRARACARSSSRSRRAPSISCSWRAWAAPSWRCGAATTSSRQ